jgi:tripartite ATP-independent transporter DctM subunit
MFASLLLALMAGYPVAFSLAWVASMFGLVGVLAGSFEPPFLLAMVFRVQGVLSNDNLLAIPMLIFIGVLLQRTGIAEDMFLTINRLLGRIAGGIAYATVLVGALLSSLTGFVSASVVAIGIIALPVMIKARYEDRLATGVVAASGTLAQIIPPSLVLIVLAEQLEVSLQAIYRGAIVPSLMLMGFYALYICLTTWLDPKRAPPGGPTPKVSGRHNSLWLELLVSVGSPTAIISLVLASISFGIATPSEGGAIGVTATLALALLRRRLTLERLRGAMDMTGLLCASIIFLLLGASFFTLVFRGFNGHIWIETLLVQLPAGQQSFVLAINAAIFFLAFFLDFFEIAFIVLPLVVPIAHKLGVDMVWLTVLFAVNLQTSFLHPPFGIALYNLRSIAPRSISTMAIYRGAVPFIVIQFLVLILLIAFPGLVLKEATRPDAPAEFVIELPPPPPPVLQ